MICCSLIANPAWHMFTVCIKVPIMLVYSDITTADARHYCRSVQMLTQCMADAEMAASLRRQQTCLQHGLPLGSYLLKPVQRILKYHILLQVSHQGLAKRRLGDLSVTKRFTQITPLDVSPSVR